jgi:hypothetical protein
MASRVIRHLRDPARHPAGSGIALPAISPGRYPRGSGRSEFLAHGTLEAERPAQKGTSPHAETSAPGIVEGGVSPHSGRRLSVKGGRVIRRRAEASEPDEKIGSYAPGDTTGNCPGHQIPAGYRPSRGAAHHRWRETARWRRNLPQRPARRPLRTRESRCGNHRTGGEGLRPAARLPPGPLRTIIQNGPRRLMTSAALTYIAAGLSCTITDLSPVLRAGRPGPPGPAAAGAGVIGWGHVSQT